MSKSDNRLIDCEAQSIPEEYVRMFGFQLAAGTLLWASCRIAVEPAAGWMFLICPPVLLRYIGPMGKGMWRPLLTTTALSNLFLGMTVLDVQSYRFATLSMLILLGLKVLLENVKWQRAHESPTDSE